MGPSSSSLEDVDVSERLRFLMTTHKLTVANLAERAGVSKSAMEKYLAGPSSPRATAIASICLSMKVSADWLLLGQEDDLFTVRSIAMSVIMSLMEDLKRDEAMGEIFSSMVLGSPEWRAFARDLSFERAVELRDAVASRREKDAAEGLQRNSGPVVTDLQTGETGFARR